MDMEKELGLEEPTAEVPGSADIYNMAKELGLEDPVADVPDSDDEKYFWITLQYDINLIYNKPELYLNFKFMNVFL